MKKRGKLLEILNSKLVIILLIFGIFFLATIFAGNVFVTDGDLDVDGQISQSGASRIKAVRNTAQTIPSESYTKIQYNTEVYDNLGEYDNTNYRFTATEEGYYLVTARILFALALWDKDRIVLRLYKNGVVNVALGETITPSSFSVAAGTDGSTILYLEEGDYIDVRVYHNRGTNTDLQADSNYNYFTVHRES